MNSEYLLDSSLNALAPLYKQRRNDIEYLYKQAESLKNKLTLLSLPKFAPFYGMCIGDIHSGNTYFAQLNQPTLFDFDQCGYGWRAFDIGNINTSITWKIDSKVIRAFLDGYQSVHNLSNIELVAIPLFTKVAHIWVMGISASIVGDVLPYGWFTDDWLDNKLKIFERLEIDI